MASFRWHAFREARTTVAVAALVLGGVTVLAGTASAGTTTAATVSGPRSLAQEVAAVRPAGVPAGAGLLLHNCQVIHRTNDGAASIESVHCADVWDKQVSPTVLDVWGGNEVLCQTLAGTLADCPSIQESAELIVSGPEPANMSESGTCGTRLGHSDCGARRVENVTPGAGLSDNDAGICFVHAIADDTVTTPDGATVEGITSTIQTPLSCK